MIAVSTHVRKYYWKEVHLFSKNKAIPPPSPLCRERYSFLSSFFFLKFWETVQIGMHMMKHVPKSAWHHWYDTALFRVDAVQGRKLNMWYLSLEQYQFMVQKPLKGQQRQPTIWPSSAHSRLVAGFNFVVDYCTNKWSFYFQQQSMSGDYISNLGA